MGLLDQLWDDTVAGPRPENGLGKLRKHNTFGGFRSQNSGKESDGNSMRPSGDDPKDGAAMKVTRSIMIVKPPGISTSSPPASPAGSSTPGSPFSGSREPFRFRRRSTSDAYDQKASRVGPKSPASP